EAFETQIKGQLEGLLNNFHQMVGESQHTLDALQYMVGDQVGEHLSKIESLFDNQLVSALKDVSHELERALDALDKLSDSEVTRLADQLRGAIHDINTVMDKYREIQPYLRQILALV